MADQSDQIGRAKIVVDGDIKPLSDSLKNAEQQTTQSMGRMAESADRMARATGEASKSAGRSLSAMAEAAKASTAQFRELVSSVSAVVGAVTRMVSVAGLAVGSLVAIGRGILYLQESSERARSSVNRASNAIENFRLKVGLVELTDHQKRIDEITAAYHELNAEILKTTTGAAQQEQLFRQANEEYHKALRKAREEEDRRIQEEENERINRELIAEEEIFRFRRKLWEEQQERERKAREEARRQHVEDILRLQQIMEEINKKQLDSIREMNRERIRGLNEYADRLAGLNERNLAGFSDASLEAIRQEVERIGQRLGRGS